MHTTPPVCDITPSQTDPILPCTFSADTCIHATYKVFEDEFTHNAVYTECWCQLHLPYPASVVNPCNDIALAWQIPIIQVI